MRRVVIYRTSHPSRPELTHDHARHTHTRVHSTMRTLVPPRQVEHPNEAKEKGRQARRDMVRSKASICTSKHILSSLLRQPYCHSTISADFDVYIAGNKSTWNPFATHFMKPSHGLIEHPRLRPPSTAALRSRQTSSGVYYVQSPPITQTFKRCRCV